MATQRLIVAVLAGESGIAVAALFHAWTAHPDPVAVDRFCGALRENGTQLPVVYFCEWVDRWLMGDLVPGPGTVVGQRFEAACLSAEEALILAKRCGQQFAEEGWLATRLREAAAAWGDISDQYAVVVAREIVGPSIADDEVRASLNVVPHWLFGR